jgi:hypothetical protein
LVEECGRLLPQTIPHPIAKCAKGWAARFGSPTLEREKPHVRLEAV